MALRFRLDYTPKKNDNLSFIYIGSRARETRSMTHRDDVGSV
jgi:hypothetical protein